MSCHCLFPLRKCKRVPGSATITNRSPSQTPRGRGNRQIQLSTNKHAYSNILKILQPKKENFQIKNSDIFHISSQNIDCGYSSNEYPQYVLSRNKKNNAFPYKPQFYYIKVGFKGAKIIYRRVFMMVPPLGGASCLWLFAWITSTSELLHDPILLWKDKQKRGQTFWWVGD